MIRFCIYHNFKQKLTSENFYIWEPITLDANKQLEVVLRIKFFIGFFIQVQNVSSSIVPSLHKGILIIHSYSLLSVQFQNH